MTEPDPFTSQGAPTILGERSIPLVARTVSTQAQLSNRLALALIGLLGVLLLGWYYQRQFTRQKHSRQDHAEASTEMLLPPLNLAVPGRAAVAATAAAALAPVPALPEPVLAQVPHPRAPSAFSSAGASTRAARAVQRRLQGDVYAGPLAHAAGAVPPGDSPMGSSPTGPAATAASAATPGALAAPDTVPASARRLRGRSLLLSKGTFIDCTLETALDSTLPGITTCVTASDTFSSDGRVVLLERGTRLFGETQGQVQQGSARVYVLWTEARTPAGIVVPLTSPGTDELGRAGLPGKVQRHFWERFGAAMLLSTIDGAVQAGVQASAAHGGTVIYNPIATQDVMTEILKSTVAIAPTVIKRNGDRIEVLVARDVDFTDVYTLRASAAGHE